MANGIVRQLRRAQRAVRGEISANQESGNVFARGLSGEGFDGGYQAALSDVLLALNGVMPQRWEEWNQRLEERTAR